MILLRTTTVTRNRLFRAIVLLSLFVLISILSSYQSRSLTYFWGHFTQDYQNLTHYVTKFDQRLDNMSRAIISMEENMVINRSSIALNHQPELTGWHTASVQMHIPTSPPLRNRPRRQKKKKPLGSPLWNGTHTRYRITLQCKLSIVTHGMNRWAPAFADHPGAGSCSSSRWS